MLKKPLLSLLLALAVSPLAAADYSIDATHSDVAFSIGYWSVGKVKGNFSDFSGSFSYDEKNVSKSKVEATVKVTSINTKNGMRDDHLRSGDFFDVEKNPTATFKSKKVEAGKEKDSLIITGDLTLRGVTKEVVLKGVKTGEGIGGKGESRLGLEASTVISRKDYGIAWNKTNKTGEFMLGDDVKLEFEIQGVKK